MKGAMTLPFPPKKIRENNPKKIIKIGMKILFFLDFI
tara:strand:+ start:65795 stop:65905 length:111 start_codon:yes stop_codon:yes gene_type:complete